ncbi:MAG TPA: hypothetical protein VFT62_07895 [Mycobacteriales bacterium]|nr:hypothetical protein [Mycobacteriales bacterium]
MTDDARGSADLNGHLDLDALADLDEGLLPEAAAELHAAHLATCAECQARAARVQSARTVLRELPAVTIPPAVEQRLAATLRGATPTVVPLERPSGRWRRHPSAAALGAVAAAAALIAAIVVGTTTHGSGNGESASRAPGARGPAATLAQPATFPVLTRGERYTRTNAARLAQQLVSAATGGAAGTAAQPQATAPTPGAGAPLRAAGSSSAPSGSSSGAGAATVAPAVPAALQPLFTNRALLLQCVAALTGNRTTRPLAVDFGRYSDKKTVGVNKPALVILLPGTDPSKDEAWIVGPACATADNNDLYLYQTVPASG